MRSVVLILCTLAVLGGGFAAYLLLLGGGSPHAMSRTITPPTRADRPGPTSRSLRGLGVGNSVWIKRYDPKSGELASQFKAEQYLPQPDGVTVHVIDPQAEFFTDDGSQRLRIEGVDGDVLMNLPPPDANGKMAAANPAQAPDRGKLRDVTLSMFQPADAAQPMLVLRMNNATFDNDTFRIATDAYTDSAGHRIDADQVPVVVRGRDYDFDGRGLVIRWNERDRKLQLLAIAHGDQLIVKNPGALSTASADSPGQAPNKVHRGPPMASAPGLSRAADARVRVVPVVAKSHEHLTRAERARRRHPHPVTEPAAPPKIARSNAPVIYRATFQDNIRIFEGEQQIVAGEAMHVDLLQPPARDSTTQPSEEDLTEADPSAASMPASSRPSKRSHHASATGAADDAPAAQDRRAEPPIIIKWTGTLRVVPLEAAPEPDLQPDKAIVEIIGNPVILTRDGGEARCGSVVYNSADGTGSLRSSPGVPRVTMMDPGGARITTPRIDYTQPSPGQRLAILSGPGRAQFPFVSDNGQSQDVNATWSQRCRLYLAEAGGGAADLSSAEDPSGKNNLAIERAVLDGDVHVDHPQMKLVSDQLALLFEPHGAATAPSSGPAEDALADASNDFNEGEAGAAAGTAQVRQILARGNVHCQMAGAGPEAQTIDSQNLQVDTAHTAAGKTYAKTIMADGDVKASQAGQVLQARHLVAHLAPAAPADAAHAPADGSPAPGSAAPGGSVKLVSLTATQDVHLTTRDGASATADRLTSTPGPAGGQQYELIGSPHATVTNGQTTIAGQTIDYDPQSKLARIPGPGTIHGVEPSDPRQAVDIAWAGNALVNGKTDWIDAVDRVKILARQSDGSVDHATADRLRARLGPKAAIAATKPSSQPATQVASPATQPSTRPAGTLDNMNFLAGKDIVFVSLLGHAEVRSELAGATGELTRGLDLLAETINYDRAAGRLVVPVPGQMRYQDHRLPASRPAGDAGNQMSGARGATAFEWQKSLVYDQPAMHATMSGDVHIVHKPDPGAGQPFDLRGEVLEAFLERDLSSTRPATRPASTASVDQAASKVRLKRIEMRQDVRITSPRLDIDAIHLAYDPIQQVLTADGDDRHPVKIFDRQTGATSMASRMIWNTQTDQFQVTDLGGRLRR